MSTKPIIRQAQASDIPTILALIRELAIYEKELDSCLATEELLSTTLGFTGEKAYAQTLLVFDGAEHGDGEGKAAGMALYFTNYSTWRAKPGVYLEDLFVRPEFRGKGYGTALLAALAKEVISIDGGRLEWSVLDWNTPSIKFYESIGAKPMGGWTVMRVDGGGLEALSKLGPAVEFGIAKK